MVALGRSWLSSEIAAVVGGTLVAEEDISLTHLAWDSRLLQTPEPSLFVALRAQRDGHAYIAEAFTRGARLCLTEKPLPYPHILVADTWEALLRWAAHWRRQLPYPLVGITGRLGKTWVKEWLAYLLEGSYTVVRSPGSFNSRLGIAASLLSFPPKGDIGLVEVGISEPGDMARVAPVVAPQFGILTLVESIPEVPSPAHTVQAAEYYQLFSGACWVVALGEGLPSQGGESPPPCYTVGEGPSYDFSWQPTEQGSKGFWHLPDGGQVPIELPEASRATWQNALLAAAAAYLLGVSIPSLQTRLSNLPPLPQRLQWTYDTAQRLWLNDTYHADYASVRTALEEFLRCSVEPKTIILSDFSPDTEESHRSMIARIAQHFRPEQVHLIGPIFSRIGWGNVYPDRETFLRTASLEGGAFLLKGSRRFRMEELLPELTGYGRAPELRVDWEKVYRNLAYLRRRLPPQTRLLAMLKAEAYGSGDLLMATFLQRQGINYIGVAYTQEALRLRKAGIRVPILVLYPDRGPSSLYQTYQLTAAVGTWEALDYWAGQAPLHIEFDTGMGRMGFLPEETEAVLGFLHKKKAQVTGVFSHLAAAEAPEDPRTRRQLVQFAELYRAFRTAFPEVLGHLLNTAGILHIAPEAAYDMVRVGIGLYGIGEPLEEATALYAPLLRVQRYPAGTSLNYGFRSRLPEGGLVGTVALGYADGALRSWAEQGGYVFWQGQKAPLLPPINMDLLLVQLPAPKAAAGDWIEVWGPHRSLAQLAQEMQTSPYEVLARLSPRVRKLYRWGSL